MSDDANYELLAADDDQLHFTLFESEFNSVERLVLEMHETTFEELNIGRALGLLSSVVIAAVRSGKTSELIMGQEFEDTDNMDRGEFILNYLHKLAKARGKIVVDVVVDGTAIVSSNTPAPIIFKSIDRQGMEDVLEA